MKRLTLLLGVAMFSLSLYGCGEGGSPRTVPLSEDPNVPAEVREAEAKKEKQWAERAARSEKKVSGAAAKKNH